MINKINKEQLKEAFATAEPFPHIVIDNFLDETALEAALNAYPDENDTEVWGWKSNDKNSIKLMCQDAEVIERRVPEVDNVIKALNSDEWLAELSDIVNMPNLQADSSLSGGGMHQLNNGGFLRLHVDFNIADSLPHLNRRLNIILFLNKDWKPEYGGQLELWNTDCTKKIVSVEPEFNRAVIFDTQPKDGIQPWHGNPNKVNTPEGVARRSIALYYYTEEKPDTPMAEKHRTLYQQ